MEEWARWQLYKEFAIYAVLGVAFIASLIWFAIDCIRAAMKERKRDRNRRR